MRGKGLFISAILIFLVLFSGCQKKREGLNVVGSTSVQPFAEALAEEYMKLHPEEKIFIQGGGSSAGIQAVETGAAQVGMSSRNLLDEEKSLISIPIIYDAIAVVVNRKNPVRELTLEEVRKIFSGEITRWSELGGEKHRITLFSREEGSGTRESFQHLILGKKTVSLGALVQDSNGAVRQVVADDPHAIGYISLGLVDERVKALRIGGIDPTVENVQKGQYRFVRPFLFVFRAPPEGPARRFLDFILSPEGQKLLVQEGLVSMTSPAEQKGTANSR